MRQQLSLALIALLIACSPETQQPTSETATTETRAQPSPPSADEARAIIEASAELGDFEFTNASFTLPLQRQAMNDAAAAAAKDLTKAGWIAFDGAGNLILPEKAKTDKRFLIRPNGFLDIVPLAKKELGGVTAVRPDPEGAAADFSWKWIPNDVGRVFRSGPLHDRFAAEHFATATLIHDGSSWTILRIRPRVVTPAAGREK